MKKRDKELLAKYSKLLSKPEHFYLDPDYSLEQFCVDMDLNRTYASRFSNNQLGMPFRTLLATLRVNHAVEIMKYKDITLTEVSRLSGFASDISFRRAYVKIFGKNPSEGRGEQL